MGPDPKVWARLHRHAEPPYSRANLHQQAASGLSFLGLISGAACAGDGLITYMRTDGVQLSPDALAAVRAAVAEVYGPDAVPKQPHAYK